VYCVRHQEVYQQVDKRIHWVVNWHVYEEVYWLVYQKVNPDSTEATIQEQLNVFDQMATKAVFEWQ